MQAEAIDVASPDKPRALSRLNASWFANAQILDDHAADSFIRVVWNPTIERYPGKYYRYLLNHPGNPTPKWWLDSLRAELQYDITVTAAVFQSKQSELSNKMDELKRLWSNLVAAGKITNDLREKITNGMEMVQVERDKVTRQMTKSAFDVAEYLRLAELGPRGARLHLVDKLLAHYRDLAINGLIETVQLNASGNAVVLKDRWWWSESARRCLAGEPHPDGRIWIGSPLETRRSHFDWVAATDYVRTKITAAVAEGSFSWKPSVVKKWFDEFFENSHRKIVHPKKVPDDKTTYRHVAKLMKELKLSETGVASHS